MGEASWQAAERAPMVGRTMREHDPDDLRCVLCGRAIEPPLLDPTLLSVQQADDYNSLATISFFVHDGCIRQGAHPAVAQRVRERLEERPQISS